MNHGPAYPPLTGTFEEVPFGETMIARLCSVELCENPMCDCRLDPSVLFIYSASLGDGAGEIADGGWVAGRFIPGSLVDDMLAGFDPANHHHMVVNSILFGVPWRFFCGGQFSALLDHQARADHECPDWYRDRDLSELRRLRAAINEVDPLATLHLLKLAYYISHETGGDHFPGHKVEEPGDDSIE